MLKTLLAATASVSLAVSATAADNRICISEAENEALVANLLPSLLTQVERRCTPMLGGGYLAANGDALADELSAYGQASEATTVTVFERVLRTDLPRDPALLDAGRTMMAAGIAASLDERACETIDRLTASLAPLPAENFASVFALFLEMGIADNKDVPWRVCRMENGVSGAG